MWHNKTISNPFLSHFYNILYVYVAIRTIWICDDEEFGASKYKSYALFSGDIIASYDAEFGASKYKLYTGFSDGFTASYDAEFDAFKIELYGLFIGDIITSYDAEFDASKYKLYVLFVGWYYHAFAFALTALFAIMVCDIQLQRFQHYIPKKTMA